MNNFKTMLTTTFVFILLVPAVFAYDLNIEVNSNIADFHTGVYKCSNSECGTITEYQKSNTGTTQNSYNLVGLGDDYYVEYDYKGCYTSNIFRVHTSWWVIGTYPHDVIFEKKQNCNATINNLTISDDNIGVGGTITIKANVHSAFEYPPGVPKTAVIPDDIRGNYSSETSVTVYANGIEIAHQIGEILLSSNKDFVFNWTSTEVGTYNITVKSEIIDCACDSNSSINQTSFARVVEVICLDNDGDGYNSTSSGCGHIDCDDNNPNIYPGAQEVCNGLDDDCDSIIDDGENDLCDDGLYCNGAEVCVGELGCQSGMPVGCSDGNECTDDICNEDLNQCENPNLPVATLCGQEKDCPPDGCSGPFVELYPDDSHDTCDEQGNCIEYSCVMEDSYCSDNDPNDGINGNICDAECDQDTDCNATDCDSLDGCIGNDYYDYKDVENDCVNCLCEINQCGDPTIYENDPKCTECQTDDDCNRLDNDYCDGDVIKHDEGRCINYECEVKTTEVEDCSQKDGINNECGLIEWSCSEELNRTDCVVANVNPDDDLCPDSCQGTVRNNGSCNPVTYNCDYIQEDCNDYDTIYCDGGLIKRDNYICTILNSSGWAPPPPSRANCVLNETEIIQNCDDGFYCNGEETCDNTQCMQGTPINCLANNLPIIATCNNNPDNNPFTWDYFGGFTSICNEQTDSCTEGTITLTYTCDKTRCDAECEDNDDCQSTECDDLDDCIGEDYYDYDDETNDCLSNCECESNQCGNPIIYYSDSRCTECQTDDDCNNLDDDYCESNIIMHDEGKCINYQCQKQTTKIEDCSERNGIMNYCGLMEWSCSEELNRIDCVVANVNPDDDLCPDSCQGTVRNDGSCNPITLNCDYIIKDCDDGLYCNGQETCSNAQCVQTMPIDCSANNLEGISTCNNNPDNNPFTFDYFAGFTSVCDEDLDKCKTGTITLTHTCDMQRCDAECEDNLDCLPTECDHLDDCMGNDYHDYSDIVNDCLEDCKCEQNQCSNPIISYNDPRCTECQTDDDCNNLDKDYCDGDVIKHDEGRCVNYKCEVETIEVEDCSQKNGINNECGLIGWSCSEELNMVDCVVANVNPDDDLCLDSCQGTVRNDGSCNPTTFNCDYIIEDCDDGLYCNGQETCSNAQCVQGTSIGCSANNLEGISTCNNNPDNNPFTWDYAAAFTSVCDEENDRCITINGNITLTHTCSKKNCSAECEQDSDCNDLDSFTKDKCLNCVCQHLEIKCFADKDCYDSDSSTIDVCVNPGTINSYCAYRKAHLDFIPRKKFLINQIRINQLVYDEVKPGDLLFVDLNFENIGRYNTKYATIMVTIPELGISRKLGPFKGPEIDEVMSKGLYLEIPKDAKQGVYTARISLSDLNGIRRTRHRDFRIIEY